MNYYYDLPTDIINLIDDKVNNLYKEEHKKVFDTILGSIKYASNPNSCSMRCCIGGQAFNIRDKMFCSPRCGNIYWNLTRSDEDYWPNTEQGDSDADVYSDSDSDSEDE